MQVQGEIQSAVTVAEFKRSRHIMESDVEDDASITALIAAAQDVVESAINRPLTSRVAIFDCRALGGLRWWFPCAPVESVSEIKWQRGHDWVDLDATGVVLEQGHGEPQLVFPSGFWADVSDGAVVQITATVGLQAQPLERGKQAVILLAGEWYEAGIALDDMPTPRMSFGVHRLIKQVAYHRPKEWAAV